MSNSYKLNRTCPKCGCRISDKNKSGYCNKHRDRSGPNNPMYGRSVQSCMTPEKIEKWKENLSKGSKQIWQKEEYRAKVIASNTGKKRTEEFRKGQSERTKQSYVNDPELRKKRGELFSECWKDGRNHYHGKSTNRSKLEVELFDMLVQSGKFNTVERQTLHAANGKWYYPDILINGKFIVEFYGDYYHANPEKYDDNEQINKKGITAKEVHDIDAARQKALEDIGYKYMVVWQSEWKADKNAVLKRIDDFANSISS